MALLQTFLISFIMLFTQLITAGDDNQDPVSFENSDHCHVCGMMITKSRGPKGQAFENSGKQIRKFCSTMEMISWYLLPKNKQNVSAMYVHDMSKTPWDKPDDSHLIPATEAIYVMGSEMSGAMGPTLASFSARVAAEDFVSKHGGMIKSFDRLTLRLLKGRKHKGHKHH